MRADIEPLAFDSELARALQTEIDGKTKPPGSLGELERIALRLGLIQQTLTPRLTRPTIVVCAADHGAAAAGVSAFPREVTAQMVLNFLAGGAAINAFCAAAGLQLCVADIGVDYDFSGAPGVEQLIDAKIARGTANYIERPAMSAAQRDRAMAAGAALVERLADDGCTLVGFGEMGIGNSASAALLMSLLLERPLADCVGAGAGLDAAGVERKRALLERARARIIESHGGVPDAATVLAEAGGLELAALVGAMHRAAQRRLVVLVDGFIAGAALLAARATRPALLDYCLFSHRSAEAGHRLMLEQLGARPLLDLDLRLGEGSGAALAYPLVNAAAAMLSEMASFAAAGVSGRR